MDHDAGFDLTNGDLTLQPRRRSSLPEPKDVPVMLEPERWTQVDEAKFAEMQARRERVQSQRRALARNALEPFFVCVYAETDISGDAWKETVTDLMIQNADTIRDALAPYDSGVRPAKEG